ncbi:MAG: hypothetical protein ACE37D_15250 [Pseudomonadales bacterium]
MPANALVKYLLWDFGDTLATWRGGNPEWTAAYAAIDRELGTSVAWHMGSIETEEIVARLATLLHQTEAEVLHHLMRSELFELFPFTYEFFAAQHLPQSIVTVNPSLFREMAGALELDLHCDTIVISGEERSIDKGKLCEVALRRVGVDCDNDRVLLIDNKQSNLDAWIARGGLGYLYAGDKKFQEDTVNGIDGLITK